MELRKESSTAIGVRLHFVTLPKIFRLIGQAPDRILEAGYNPTTDPQVAIFGSQSDLATWRDSRGLSEKDYPTHSSSMGTHIDVYGQDNIDRLMERNSTIGIREYRRSMKKS